MTEEKQFGPIHRAEYVDGPDLRRYLAGNDGKLPEATATRIMAQVAAALAAAHAADVVHLNLKLENIRLVRRNDSMTVRITESSETALVLGSTMPGPSGYAAPEITAGHRPTAAADVYALGVITAELITGVRPDSVADGLPDLPPALRPLVRGFLAPDPRDRPSASSAAAQLRYAVDALTGETATPAPAPAPAVRAVYESPPGPAPAPANPGSPRRIWFRLSVERTAILAAAAAVTVTSVVVLFKVGVGSDDSTIVMPTASMVAGTTTAATPAPATSAATDPAPIDTVTLAQPMDHTRGTWAAHLPDDAGTLYIAIRDGVAVAYMCDGDRLEAWFKGSATNASVTLTGKGGAKLTGSFTIGNVSGEVTVQGRTYEYDVPAVHKPSGLYRASAKVRNADVKGGWIVLADGSQVGVLTVGGTPRPAPRLDTAGKSATLEGATVSATEVDVDSGGGF